MSRSWAIAVAVLAVGFAFLAVFRRWVLLAVFTVLIGDALLDPVDEGDGVDWFDDYYTVEIIDPGTFAIGEPRFSQQNYNYLIFGTERAVLFDSGPGVRDIRPVVASLTELPVTVIPSHLHWDHVGHFEEFERVAVVDLPHLRERAPDDVLRPTLAEHLGFMARISRPEIRVAEWLALDSAIDLGGRALTVLLTPGHTPESISLHDAERSQLFTGDYLTEGGLLAFAPNSSLPAYLDTAERLVDRLPDGVTLLTAHRFTPPGAPIMRYADLVDLRATLRAIRAGTAESEVPIPFPRAFRVNEELVLYSDIPSLEPWEDRP